jgi:hypothetical protein
MSAQAYRRNAAECLRLSVILNDPQARAVLRQMAFAWTELAERAERKQEYGPALTDEKE